MEAAGAVETPLLLKSLVLENAILPYHFASVVVHPGYFFLINSQMLFQGQCKRNSERRNGQYV